jgi:hemolysin III
MGRKDRDERMSFADLLTADELELAEHYPNRAEHAADAWVHAAGIALAAIGGAALFLAALTRGGLAVATATSLYALCLIAMLACSAAYNLTRPSPARRILRRLDEAAIFLMIAGSYTPFTLQRFDDWGGIALTGLVWLIALAGGIGKICFPNLSDKLWCSVYVAFGWLAVFIMPPLAVGMPVTAIFLLAAGGIVYTTGVLIYLNQKLPYRRAIWHGFVLTGAGLHYAAIFTGVVMA